MQPMTFTHSQVATSGTARDINRGIVLNLIRRRQPISLATTKYGFAYHRAVDSREVGDLWIYWAFTTREKAYVPSVE